MTARPLWLWIASLLLTGCASVSGPLWHPAPAAPLAHRYASCDITLPAGWVYLQTETDAGAVLLATDTGAALQAIRVIHRPVRRAFPTIEQPATVHMPLEVLAERFIADTASRFEMDVVEVVENRPVTLAGQDAFRVHWRYRIGQLRYQGIALGTLRSDGLYLVTFNAPHLHYFDRYRADFEAAARTFALR